MNTLNVSAKSTVSGEGAIQTANITAGNVTISQKPEKTNVSPGVTATVGGAEVSGEKTPAGGGGGGGGGGVPTPSRSMTWSGGQFTESAANDGSISNSITVTLDNETFSAGSLDLTTDYTVSNVPAGLAVSVTKTSDTAASITLTGNAAQHTAAGNISNLAITFTNSAFSGGNAGSVANSSRTDLAVTFNKALTIMFYSDADNDLEGFMLEDIDEMKRGVTGDVNLIALIDRSPGYSSDQDVLGEDFTDTRLYKIARNSAARIGGGAQFPEITTASTYEANMGDAVTLKKFIQFCKANYAADKYALILENHGGGVRGGGVTNKSSIREVCFDETSGNDRLRPGGLLLRRQ